MSRGSITQDHLYSCKVLYMCAACTLHTGEFILVSLHPPPPPSEILDPPLSLVAYFSIHISYFIVNLRRDIQRHAQLRIACHTHTQLEGSNDARQPYQRQRASQKAPLCKLKSCSDKGSVVGQMKESFSAANIME